MYLKKFNIIIKSNVVLIFITLFINNIKAQTGLLYYQNYNTSINFNPAFTGMDTLVTMGVYWQKEDQYSRSGIANYNYVHNTFEAFVDTYVQKVKGGCALILTDKVFEDKTGSRNQSYLSGSYSRTFMMGNWGLRTGIQVRGQHTWLKPSRKIIDANSFFSIDGSVGILLQNAKIVDIGLAYNRITRSVNLPINYENQDFKYFRQPQFLILQLRRAINIHKTIINTEYIHSYEFPTILYKSIQTSNVNVNVKYRFFRCGVQGVYNHYFSALRTLNLLIGFEVKRLQIIYNAGILMRPSTVFDPLGDCVGLSAVYKFSAKK